MRASLERSRPVAKYGLASAISALAIAGVAEYKNLETSQAKVEPPQKQGAELSDYEAANHMARAYALAELATSSTGSEVELVSYRYHHHHHHRHHQVLTMPPLLRRIGGCESGGGPTNPINYRATNPTSTASGGFQDLDSTWNNFAGYSRAMYAPPAVQIRFNENLLREDGTSPWVSSESCWG